MERRLLILALLLIVVLVAMSCGMPATSPQTTVRPSTPGEGQPSKSQEPPMNLGTTKPGDPVRIVKTLEVDPAKGDLESLVILNIRRTLQEETFPKKWRVVYEYNDVSSKVSGIPGTISGIHLEGLRIPSDYTIFGYSGVAQSGTEKYERLINKYALVELGTEGRAMYRDMAGKVVERELNYFDILP